jgi:hypothetical protein
MFEQICTKSGGAMDSIDAISGRYEGSGRWFQADGKTMAYRVMQTNRTTPAGFEIEFNHDFDDGSETRAAFAMTWTAPHLFRVEISGKLVGNGYFFADSCHYHIAWQETLRRVE